MIKEAYTVKPLVTERSFAGLEHGWYTFSVAKSLNKPQVVKLIKELFKVDAIEIKTTVYKGKAKRQLRTRRTIRMPAYKKVMVKLAKDQKIDLFETGGK